MKMRSLFLFLILCLFTFLLNGQSVDAVRLEVPSDINAERFHVNSLGNRGILVFYESGELNRETSRRKWYFGYFNTGFTQKWLKFVELSDKIEYISSVKQSNFLYLLFKNINGEKFDYGFYEILKYNLVDESFSTISGSIPLKADVAGFDIIGRTACLALNLKKDACDLVFIDLKTGDVNPVNVNTDIPGLIQSVYASVNNFVISVKQSRDGRYIHEYFQAYSVEGKLKWELDVSDVDAIKFFRDFAYYTTNENELLVFGTYGIVSGHNLSFKDLNNEGHEHKSEGVFFLKIDKGKQKELKYYDFFNFESISAAFKSADLQIRKINDTASNKKNRAIMAASFNVAGLNLTRIGLNEFLLSFEAYRPSYETETRMDYDFYGRPYPYTYNIFSGYDFFDVITASFDSEGNMLWNNDFSIDNILTYSKDRNSVVFKEQDYITLAYVNDGNIFSQIIDKNNDIERSKIKISTDYPKDNVTEDHFNRIVHWYDDFFLIYGYQNIRNRALDDKATRNVFYINKIAYK